MKRRIAKAIVRYRTVILIVLLLVAAWSVPQISRTRINYDLTRYLSDSTMTKRALKVMDSDGNVCGTGSKTFIEGFEKFLMFMETDKIDAFTIGQKTGKSGRSYLLFIA